MEEKVIPFFANIGHFRGQAFSRFFGISCKKRVSCWNVYEDFRFRHVRFGPINCGDVKEVFSDWVDLAEIVM